MNRFLLSLSILILWLAACQSNIPDNPATPTRPTASATATPTTVQTATSEPTTPPSPQPTNPPPTETPRPEPTATPQPISYTNHGLVLPLGEAGDFDDAAIYIPQVIHRDGRFHMFYSGFPNRNYTDGAIGYATSLDGFTWTKHEANPIVTGTQERPKAQSAAVAFIDDEWVMILDMASNTAIASGDMFRATAPSPAGPWTINPEPILSSPPFGAWNRSTTPNSLIQTESGFFLYYNGWGSAGVQLGLATSTDGLSWQYYDDSETADSPFAESDPILTSDPNLLWENSGIAPYQVRWTGQQFELFYVGFTTDPLNTIRLPENAKLGYAHSPDGFQWTKHDANPLINTNEDIWPAFGVAQIDDTYYIYYDINGGLEGIGLITATFNNP